MQTGYANGMVGQTAEVDGDFCGHAALSHAECTAGKDRADGEGCNDVVLSGCVSGTGTEDGNQWRKNRAAHDSLRTDACIHTPGVVIFKTDDSFPQRMNRSDLCTVDMISLAASNLREYPGNRHSPEDGTAVKITPEGLYKLHLPVKAYPACYGIAGRGCVDSLCLRLRSVL